MFEDLRKVMSFPMKRVDGGEELSAVLQRCTLFQQEDYPSDGNNLGTRTHVRTCKTLRV